MDMDVSASAEDLEGKRSSRSERSPPPAFGEEVDEKSSLPALLALRGPRSRYPLLRVWPSSSESEMSISSLLRVRVPGLALLLRPFVTREKRSRPRGLSLVASGSVAGASSYMFAEKLAVGSPPPLGS